MAHKEQLDFVSYVKGYNPVNFTNANVLEVGSLDINGSVRTCFSSCEYVGIDVSAGKRGVIWFVKGNYLNFQLDNSIP